MDGVAAPDTVDVSQSPRRTSLLVPENDDKEPRPVFVELLVTMLLPDIPPSCFTAGPDSTTGRTRSSTVEQSTETAWTARSAVGMPAYGRRPGSLQFDGLRASP